MLDREAVINLPKSGWAGRWGLQLLTLKFYHYLDYYYSTLPQTFYAYSLSPIVLPFALASRDNQFPSWITQRNNTKNNGTILFH